MTVYKKIDALLRENKVSCADVVKYWQKKGKLKASDLFFVGEKQKISLDAEVEEECIEISKANLTKIKVGMFWYTDNTVSECLFLTKDVKSVVLWVNDNVIYGDSFKERIYDWNKTDAFLECCATKFMFEKTMFHSVQLLEQIRKNEEVITNSLIQIGKARWIGDYWTPEEKGDNYARVFSMEDGFSFMNVKSKHYAIRPILAFTA